MMYPFDFMFERTLTFALFEMTRIPVTGSSPKTIRRLSLFTIWVRIREEIRCFSSLLRFSPSAAAMASDTHPGNAESFPYLREGTLLEMIPDIVGTLHPSGFGHFYKSKLTGFQLDGRFAQVENGSCIGRGLYRNSSTRAASILSVQSVFFISYRL